MPAAVTAEHAGSAPPAVQAAGWGGEELSPQVPLHLQYKRQGGIDRESTRQNNKQYLIGEATLIHASSLPLPPPGSQSSHLLGMRRQAILLDCTPDWRSDTVYSCVLVTHQPPPPCSPHLIGMRLQAILLDYT